MLRKQLTLPAALAVTVLGCSQPPTPNDAATEDTALDDAATSCETSTFFDASGQCCNPVVESDGVTIRYVVCRSTSEGCARVIFPDGAVEAPNLLLITTAANPGDSRSDRKIFERRCCAAVPSRPSVAESKWRLCEESVEWFERASAPR